MNQMQQDAIADRGRWAKRLGDLIARHTEELYELAKEDFAHQVGPRSVDRYAGYEIAQSEVEAATRAVAENTRAKLMWHYASTLT